MVPLVSEPTSKALILKAQQACNDADEPVLQEVVNRFVMFPIQHQPIWSMYKSAVAVYWHAGEIELKDDLEHWGKLSDNERYFLKNILAFFAASDGIVNENLVYRFAKEVKVPEARAFYTFQMAMESVHSEVYSLLIDTYIKDNAERNHLLNAMNTIPCIKKKADWTIRWIEDEDAPFALRLLAFAVVEGVFFSGAFCAIFWIKPSGRLPGLCQSNEFISRDESLHTEFAVLLYSMIQRRLPQEVVHELVAEAVGIETEFITESIPCNLLGMNSALMAQYIQFVADRLLVQLGYDKLYNSTNPFAFMERISLTQKTNFFEHTRLSEYSKARVGQTAEDQQFDLQCDF